MEKEFISSTISYEQIIEDKSGIAEKYVLINNEASIKKIYKFFTSDKKILLINGFAGTGKKQITEAFLSKKSNNTSICRYVCTQSSTINDLYLILNSFFKTNFKDFLGQDYNLLTNYREKAQYAFSRIENNIIFAIYNFDNVLEENKKEFTNYINALSELKNIKIIIESRTFDSNEIDNQETYSKIMIKALSKELFEDYFNEYDLKTTSNKLEQFYRLTRGYFLFCSISLRILINNGMDLEDLLTRYFASGQTYDKFIANEYYKFIIGTTKNAFNLFIQLRHGLNAKALLEIGAFPDSVLKTLSENGFIYQVDEMYYPTNFLKEQLSNSIKDVVYKSKLVKYYTAQCEKSLEERDFIISRESLVNEVSYCTETDITVKVEKEKEEQPKIELTPEVTQEVKKENEEVIPNLSPQELLNLTNHSLEKYDYIQALKYLSAILMNQDTYQDTNLINTSYHLLVEAYSKLSKWEYALYYLNLLEDLYRENDDTPNLDKILYEKANILYNQNKVIDAINILKRLITNTKEKEVIVKGNLLLANISILANNGMMALSHVKSALANVTTNTDSLILSELYFQHAYLSDEYKDEESAIANYLKCIGLDTTPNKYIALSYSNLGEIYTDKEMFEEAKTNFQKANELEKSLENDYGAYYTLSKIVELTPKEDKETRLRLMNEARDYAINSRDNEAIITSTVTIGDMFYDYAMPKDALIEYYNLYTQGKDIIESENLKKLKTRINDLKVRLTKEEFEELAPNYDGN